MPNAQPSPYSDTTTSPRPRTFGLMPQDVDRFAVHLDNGHGTGVPSIATCEKLLLDAAALVSMWIGDVDVLDQEGSLLVMEAAQALACGKGLSDFSKMLQEFARHRSDTFRAARVRAMAEAAAQSEAQPVAPTPPRGRVLHVVECWGNRDGRIFAGDELLTEQGHVLRVLRDVSLAESSVDVLAPVELALEENASGAPLAAGTRACWRTTRVGVAATVTIMAATITYVEAGTVPAEVLYKLVEMAKAEQECRRQRKSAEQAPKCHHAALGDASFTYARCVRSSAGSVWRFYGISLLTGHANNIFGAGDQLADEAPEERALRLDGQETKVFCAAWERAECCSTDGAPRYNVTFVTAPEHARRQWMRPFVAAHAESLSAFYGVAARFLSEAEVWAWAHFAGKTADLLRLAADHRAMDRVELEELAEAADEPAFALRLGPFALDLFVTRT